MKALRERIAAEGQNLGNGILKIDSLLNHQIYPDLMLEMGKEMASGFAGVAIDRILTVEISGIAPALMTGLALGVPVVYARKVKPITMAGPVFLETAPSHTKGVEVNLLVSAEFLHPNENILIVDDFLATGKTLLALARMVRSAKANLVGVGVVVEKSFEGGRGELLKAGYTHIPVRSLVTITSMDNGKIEMAD
ncbi:MAG TPA: xanthine phosphoribosyltransferase [Aggregatilineales bacterium]|jgi:xanthine phosphoribosyltransferase|nr:xanthine phosphoribosyltransferase [Anaerolineae bacterium]HUN05180.1 xanthine phosphoribosyltransferase [Aggregatilineales bacterium]